jgi:hypothetical protein
MDRRPGPRIRFVRQIAALALSAALAAACASPTPSPTPAQSPKPSPSPIIVCGAADTHLSADCDRIVAATLAALDLRTGQTRRIEVYGPQCVTEQCAPAGSIARVWVWTWGGVKPEVANVSQANGILTAKRAGNL